MPLRHYANLASKYLIACLSLAASTCFADLSSPRIMWAFQSEGPIRGSATVSGDSIYFGSADGYVYALAKATGETDGADHRWVLILSRPARTAQVAADLQ